MAGLAGQDKEDVRLGTLVSLRAARAAEVCNQVSVPWLLEQPWPHEGGTTMLNLDEWRAVTAQPGVSSTRVLQ